MNVEHETATDWESDLAELLSMLASTQEELLKLLGEKRQLLADANTEGMRLLAPREDELLSRLRACHASRAKLLARAGRAGLPDRSIRSLTDALPDATRKTFAPRLETAATQARLLQHQSLTNWVLVQRSLLHLSQLLEIIATGGRPEPTYGKGETPTSRGSLVNHTA